MLAAPFLLATAMCLQLPPGSLLYQTPSGQAVHLKIHNPPSASTMTFQPEAHEAAVLRSWILQHSGSESLMVPRARRLPQSAPATWKVQGSGDSTLLQSGGIVFWRYMPGQVLPVRFQLNRKMWNLVGAQLPAKTLIGP